MRVSGGTTDVLRHRRVSLSRGSALGLADTLLQVGQLRGAVLPRPVVQRHPPLACRVDLEKRNTLRHVFLFSRSTPAAATASLRRRTKANVDFLAPLLGGSGGIFGGYARVKARLDQFQLRPTCRGILFSGVLREQGYVFF